MMEWFFFCSFLFCFFLLKKDNAVADYTAMCLSFRRTARCALVFMDKDWSANFHATAKRAILNQTEDCFGNFVQVSSFCPSRRNRQMLLRQHAQACHWGSERTSWSMSHWTFPTQPTLRLKKHNLHEAIGQTPHIFYPIKEEDSVE